MEAYSRRRCCPTDEIEILEEEAMAETGTKATNEQKRARIRKSYDLSAKGDYAGSVQEAWADNGVFHSQMRGREFRGKGAITDEVKKQNQEVKTTWHVHDVLVSDDHAVALLEAEQEGRRRRIVHVMHLDDSGRISEAWAVFNPTD
jgi:SnoaL-like protein